MQLLFIEPTQEVLLFHFLPLPHSTTQVTKKWSLDLEELPLNTMTYVLEEESDKMLWGSKEKSGKASWRR